MDRRYRNDVSMQVAILSHFGSDALVQQASPEATVPPQTAEPLRRHMDAISSLEWSRTRDQAVPFGRVKFLGTILRVLARVLVQGRINERQQWINSEAYQQLSEMTEWQTQTGQALTALEQRVDIETVRTMVETQVASVRRSVADLGTQLATVERDRGAVVTTILQYGSLLQSVAEKAPELNAYKLIIVSEEVDGHTRILSGPLPDGLVPPFEARVTGPEPSGISENIFGSTGRKGVLWLHKALLPTQSDCSAFFRQISQCLRSQDAVMLISNAATDVAFDVGLLHVLYDAPFASGMRVTFVRRPLLERQALTLGYDFYLSPDDRGPVATALRDAGVWNQAEMDWLHDYLKPGAVVVDIGAQVGYFATFAARLVGETGKVIAIEPDPINASILAMNRDHLPNPDVLAIMRAAVGQEESVTRLYRSPTDFGDHQIHLGGAAGNPSTYAEWRGIGIPTPVHRMDDLLSGTGHIDIVKASTNGYDIAALRSMEIVLQRDHPIILIHDTRDTHDALQAYLTSLGYKSDRLGMSPLVAAEDESDHAPVNAQRAVRRALATIGTGEMAPVLGATLPSFEAYAHRHGYQLVVGDGNSYSRPPAWAKIPLLRRLLDSYDEVLWIDSDAVIIDDSVDLASQVSRDAYQAIVRIQSPEGEMPNTGVWFLRGEKARRLLDAVWAREEFTYHKWWENTALLALLGYDINPPVTLVQATDWSEGTQWLPLEWNALFAWNKQKHPFIRHYSAMPNAERRQRIEQDVQMRGLGTTLIALPPHAESMVMSRSLAVEATRGPKTSLGGIS